MSVWITFQGPDFNKDRWSTEWTDEQPTIRVEGFDLDYMSLTVYPPDEEMDTNLTLATVANYMNENGDECGKIGWEINPEGLLMERMPELRQYVGRRYGRIIVTAVDISTTADMERQLAEREQHKKPSVDRESPQQKEQRNLAIQNAREAARTALKNYETLLDVAKSTTKDDRKYEHLAHSLAEVRSAKRVLWFDI